MKTVFLVMVGMNGAFAVMNFLTIFTSSHPGLAALVCLLNVVAVVLCWKAAKGAF